MSDALTEDDPMQPSQTTAQRHPQLGVIETRRVTETLKPFVGALQSWTYKAAQLRGRANSPYSSAQDLTLARLEAGAILAEVRHRHSDLRSLIKGERPHSRLDDVDAAFRRLIEHLQTISNAQIEGR
jgi:hypothetical protein